MITKEKAMELIQESVSSLHRGGLIEEKIEVSDNTVFLGTGSLLDSIAYVAFITDLEERLNMEMHQDVYLALDKIHQFNADNSGLSASTLALYIIKLLKK